MDLAAQWRRSMLTRDDLRRVEESNQRLVDAMKDVAQQFGQISQLLKQLATNNEKFSDGTIDQLRNLHGAIGDLLEKLQSHISSLSEQTTDLQRAGCEKCVQEVGKLRDITLTSKQLWGTVAAIVIASVSATAGIVTAVIKYMGK
jgi:uncharacterized protein Yka (UPF0111/DUF47 family)